MDAVAGPGPSPRELIEGYLRGWFPMDGAEHAGRPVPFYDADPRGVIPLDAFRIPRSVRRAGRRREHAIRIDGDFAGVVAACADRREGVWLTPRLAGAYRALHAAGHAHSVECWYGDRLAGGLFGVALGGLFTSESMFHRASDAGSLALAATGRRLIERGFRLWDIQMVSEHTARFGAVEISGADYRRRLAAALEIAARFGEEGVTRPAG